MMWLLEPSVLAELQAVKPDAAQLVTFNEMVAARRQDGPMAATTTSDSGVTTIPIHGVVSERPNLMAMLFGGGSTTFGDIRNALAVADADDNIKSVELDIDSPGGTVAGLFPTIDAITAFSKPITARVGSLAASAAFALASAADSIAATSKAAQFGSIGTAKRFSVDADEVVVTSTNAPDKVPDVTTDAGKETVRAELDGMHELFVSAIAEGRGTDAKTVNAEFGKGAVLLAGDALNRGMIDSIESAKTNTAQSGTKTEARQMDETTLQTQHPSIYAAVLKKGADKERDRVSAHLTLGAAYNALGTATAAVLDGSEMTALITAKYVAAGANAGNISARSADDTDASPGATATAEDEEATAKAGFAEIMAAAGAACGVDVDMGAV